MAEPYRQVSIVDGAGNAAPLGTAASPIITSSAALAGAGGYTYKNFTTGAGASCKASAGTLHSITVNTLVASATITIYDSLAGSGTKIATITLPSTITGVTPFALPFDVAFTTGLFVVPSGATDVTVAFN